MRVGQNKPSALSFTADSGYTQLGGPTIHHQAFREQLSQNSSGLDHQTKVETTTTEQTANESKPSTVDRAMSSPHSEATSNGQESYQTSSNPPPNTNGNNQLNEVRLIILPVKFWILYFSV